MSDCNFSRFSVTTVTAGTTSAGFDFDLHPEAHRNEILLTVTSSQDLTIHGKMGNSSDLAASLPHTLPDQAHTAGSKTYVLLVNPGCKKFRFTFQNAGGSDSTLTADIGANRGS